MLACHLSTSIIYYNFHFADFSPAFWRDRKDDTLIIQVFAITQAAVFSNPATEIMNEKSGDSGVRNL
jgi:hypothetical protein